MSLRVLGAAAVLLAAACRGEAPRDETAGSPAPAQPPPVQLVWGSGPGTSAGSGVLRRRFGPVRDSARAVDVAAEVLNSPEGPGGGMTFRVRTFLERQGGFVVELAPEPALPGGGGLLWIEMDGTVTVLRRYR